MQRQSVRFLKFVPFISYRRVGMCAENCSYVTATSLSDLRILGNGRIDYATSSGSSTALILAPSRSKPYGPTPTITNSVIFHAPAVSASLSVCPHHLPSTAYVNTNRHVPRRQRSRQRSSGPERIRCSSMPARRNSVTVSDALAAEASRAGLRRRDARGRRPHRRHGPVLSIDRRCVNNGVGARPATRRSSRTYRQRGSRHDGQAGDTLALDPANVA